MTLQLPAGAIPPAEPAAVALLSGLLPGIDVATPTRGVEGTALPRVRVTPVGDREPPSSWERTPIFQVDVWATSTLDAATIASLLAAAWPSLRGREVPLGGYVSGAWVETQPRLLVNSSETDPPRYLLTLGLRLHAGPPA